MNVYLKIISITYGRFFCYTNTMGSKSPDFRNVCLGQEPLDHDRYYYQ